VFGVLAGLLFVFGIAVGINGLRANHAVTAQVKQLSHASAAVAGASVPAAADVPNEDKPPAASTYQVAANAPRMLTIGKIGVQARIMRTTVNARNELGTPANIFDTAWYEASAKPGQAGAMLIDGHVSGPTQNGVFYDLKKLIKGDKITVERGDGKVFTYTVQTSKTYNADAVDMAAALTPVVSGKPGLNIMTCTGKLDSTRTHFEQRLVVFASQD
jgi:LPXTG-site transpeptidase (sortase) family protein